jgi:diaminohydroxyphosphoribosylaminopyrimidine deaminase/5-amino-6-(5-phosphoribosylamino)uracil reductase
VLDARRTGRLQIDEPWQSVFAPLVCTPDAPLVIAQLGQSLDGRIATPTGHSHYVNARTAIEHLHRLRALVDAVVIGVGTAIADDPALTVRHVAGPSPARVVIDPSGRMPPESALLTDDGRRRLLITRTATVPRFGAGIEHVPVEPDLHGRLPPAGIVAALAARGLRRLLIEGGAVTVSRFLEAGCLDRLHVAVAPLIIGSGPTGVTLPPIERLDQAIRVPLRCVRLGDDMLWDVALTARHRIG